MRRRSRRAKRLTARPAARCSATIYDGEPGIDRALRSRSPGGHVFKLFCGMETGRRPAAGRPADKFEHVSIKARDHGAEERFLPEGLGFRFSDRMGFRATLVALRRRPPRHGAHPRAAAELSHYAYALDRPDALGASPTA